MGREIFSAPRIPAFTAYANSEWVRGLSIGLAGRVGLKLTPQETQQMEDLTSTTAPLLFVAFHAHATSL